MPNNDSTPIFAQVIIIEGVEKIKTAGTSIRRWLHCGKIYEPIPATKGIMKKIDEAKFDFCLSLKIFFG